MVSTPEEFAIDLSRASLHAQAQTENQLREKATTVLSAASIVVPIAALAVGHGPAGAAIPFGAAAVAYFLCARACGAALFPQDVRAGLLGSELLALGVTIVS
jgi:acetyl-CoA carboxylase alpha subunit